MAIGRIHVVNLSRLRDPALTIKGSSVEALVSKDSVAIPDGEQRRFSPRSGRASAVFEGTGFQEPCAYLHP